ncbi:MAG: amino acid ABC transporter ATP-binding protein [Clostridia bacterium]|nr:amino acid ABC transporter ATP-binding protein [Clostridia bacterium]
MLEVKNLHCSYGTNKVLKGIDFRVDQGEVIAVLGSSGSGKTTLLRCISFLESADSGTIRFGDFEKDITKVKRSEIRALRMKIGYVFQNFNLFRNMTVRQNVLEGLVTARKMDKKEANAIADEMLGKVGMLHRADYYPEQLSGGQQQRVAIARSIAFRPDVILFDEPTSALDPELTREVLNTIAKLASEGVTMVVVTHEMSFARNVANRVIFMENGVVVEDAPAKEFFENPKEEATRRFLRTVIEEAAVKPGQTPETESSK